VRAALREEIERLQTELVSDDDLKMVKTRAKAGLIRSLANNTGIAGALAQSQTIHGDWRELFRSVEKIDRVTKADIQRIAKKTFVPTNRSTAMIVTENTAPASK
jgi:predicted Zn-dependent peptidase